MQIIWHSAPVKMVDVPANLAAVPHCIQRKPLGFLLSGNVYTRAETACTRLDEAVALDAPRIFPRRSVKELELIGQLAAHRVLCSVA